MKNRCLLALIALIPGCSNLGYYFQAISGQAEIVRASRPIPALLADPATPEELKGKLALVTGIREFASEHLGLPKNGSYKSYAELGRPFVVWNVFATPEFSTEPREWCFAFAGCVNYRGYFSREAAEDFARRLDPAKNDVYIGGVPAYSTLGWLNDPVLSTFVHYPETELARLIFHELAHQVVYVPGDTQFNESFATAVEREGMRRWLESQGSQAQREQYAISQERRAQFVALMLKYRKRLEKEFSLSLDDAEKRARKAEAFREMADEYRKLKTSWNGFPGYDRWFSGKLNNAHLASISVYTALVPGFEALLAESRGDLKDFYSRVQQIAALPEEERRSKLKQAAVHQQHAQQ
jgi:predicted aminopeptidase